MRRLPPIDAMAVLATSAFASDSAEAVISISDGDTLRVLEGGRRITIRLTCIDAPEMVQAPDGANTRRYLQSRLGLGLTA